jgi:TRAP-type mannitol/chloroaromatic compound transport system substrate-binding protein
VLLNKLNAEAIEELKSKHGVTIHRTPDEILKKILETWDQIAKEEEAKNPFFKKVYESQRKYAALVVPSRRFVYPNYNVGADHYWPEKK